MNDRRLFRWLALLIFVPLLLAVFGGDRFRYSCQDPANWEKTECQKPLCDVTRTCPEHIFKGGRDPRLGPPDDKAPPTPSMTSQLNKPGAACK